MAIGHGGRRLGAGRKPKSATLLKRRIQTEGVKNAEEAFEFILNTMRNTEIADRLRVECARDILNRVLGKPTLPIEGVDTEIRLILDI